MRRISRRIHQRQLRRALDDEDWGTSSPTPAMNPSVPPSPSVTPISPPSDTTPDILPVVSASDTPLAQQIPPAVKDHSLSTAFGRLKQQELKSYTCTFSPRCVVTIYFAIALTFIPLGASIFAATARITSTDDRAYSQDCKSQKQPYCLVFFTPRKTIKKPSYLFYRLVNFHQNARDYVKSRSPTQNRGIVPTTYEEVANCDRWLCPEGGSSCTSATNFNASKIIYPCGLTARYVFNDTFTIKRSDGKFVSTNKRNIAWWADAKYKFRQNKNSEEFTMERNWSSFPKPRSANDLLEDNDFVVWMRLAAFPTFDKLYTVIQEDLLKDVKYTVNISDTFSVDEFGGDKFFYITTTSWFGTRNAFLAAAYLLVGLFALVIAVILLFMHIINPNAQCNRDPSILLKERFAELTVDAD